MLSRGGASRPTAEVVDESNGAAFQRYSCATGLQEKLSRHSRTARITNTVQVTWDLDFKSPGIVISDVTVVISKASLGSFDTLQEQWIVMSSDYIKPRFGTTGRPNGTFGELCCPNPLQFTK